MNLPAILSARYASDDEVELDVEIVSELESFRGHFPGRPILPGVVQIDWAVRFASIYLKMNPTPGREVQVKFRNIICPEAPLSLKLLHNRAKSNLVFTYCCRDVIMSSGQIRIELAS